MSIYDVNGNSLEITGLASVENFGAVGDGVTDDSAAFQQALNQKGLILCNADKTYRITSTLRMSKDTILDLNGGTIKSEHKHLIFNFTSADTNFTAYNGNGNICIRNGIIEGGAISFAHGENILIENVHFKNSINDHFLEIAGCKNYRIVGCSFVGMADVQTSVYEYINLDHCNYTAFPWMSSGSAFYDGTPNKDLLILESKFSLGSGAYAYGYNAIGVHYVSGLTNHHDGITISNCEVYGFTGCGLRINGMDNVYVNNNRIETVGDGIVIGDVGSCDGIVIKNNFVVSSNGSKLVKTANRYTDLTVVGNSTEGIIEDF